MVVGVDETGFGEKDMWLIEEYVELVEEKRAFGWYQ